MSRFSKRFDRKQIEKARRDAEAAAHEADMIRGFRARAERVVNELGKHERQNHFVDIVYSVARGIR